MAFTVNADLTITLASQEGPVTVSGTTITVRDVSRLVLPATGGDGAVRHLLAGGVLLALALGSATGFTTSRRTSPRA